jgi:hypothetical protein
MSDRPRAGNADGNPVTKEDDYRRFAAHTLELAGRTSNLKDKGHLLAMAEAWLNLADKIARLVRGPKVRIDEHPAIRAQLEPERREADY